MRAWRALICASLFAPCLGWAQDIQLLRIVTAEESPDKKPFEEIRGVHLDADGTLYLTDSGNGALYVFAASGPTAHILAGKGLVFGSRKLAGIARLDDATLAIANSGDDFIAALDAKRAQRLQIGEAGSAEGRLDSPAGLAASARGRLYVADRGNHRVSVFTREGLFLFAFGNDPADPLRLSKPTQIAVDAEERVYVLDDREGGRLTVFSHQGEALKRLSAEQFKGQAERAMRFSALAVDAHGRVFLADKANGKILELDWRAGKPVFSFGSKGAGRGQFGEVTAMSVTADRKLAIGDSENRKVEIYQLPPAPAPAGPALPTVARGPALVAAAGESAPDCDSVQPLPAGGMLCVQRETRRVLRVAADGKAEPFGGEFARPRLVALDERDIAVVDGDHIKLFAHDGKARFTIGGGGSRDGEFDSPAGAALGERIYVSDTDNRRIQIFSRDGVYLDKIVNSKEQPLLQRPGAIALDAAGNLYVADNGLYKVRVFGPDKRLLYDVGEPESSPQRFKQIHALAVDRDDNLYVLAATAANDYTVRVYNGPRLAFAFGAQLERGIGWGQAATVALLKSEKTTLAVYDRARRSLQSYRYLQVPPQVGGLVISGGPRETALLWQKAPGSFIERYRVYGASESDGPYEHLMEARETRAVLAASAKGHRYYRVTAVSHYDVEGPAAPAREDLFQSGHKLYREGAYAEAAAVFVKARRENPENGHALEYLGRCRLEQGQTEDALTYFQDLGSIAGFAVASVNLQAEALLRARHFVQARALLDKARAERRADGETYALCGRLSLKLGDAVGASDCLEQALKSGADNAETHFLLGQTYVKLGAPQKGLAEFDKAVQLAPNDAAVWTQSAQARQALKLHKEAIAHFEKALALDAVSAEARLGAARSHIALQNYDRANSIALSMSGTPDQEAAGYYLLGVIAAAKKQPQDAVLAFTRAGAKDPRDVEAWLGLADAHAQLKNSAAAQEALQQAVKAGPDSFEAQQRLALTLQKDEKHAEALPYFERAAALQPGHAPTRLAYAQSLAAAERLKEASAQAAEAARLTPDQVAPLTLLADIAKRQGKHGDAIGHLTKALKLEPGAAALHLKLGETYLETSAYDEAQTQLEKTALLDPKGPRPHELLGAMYLERRLFEAAIKSLGRAAELDPSAQNKAQLNAAYAEKKKSQEFKQNAPRILLQDLTLKRVFSSAYKQYAGEPVGSVKIRNLGNADYSNLKLSFHIKGYMDFPYSAELPTLTAGGVLEAPLFASFSNKILGIDEDTGVQVEVKVTFYHEGREATAELTRPMTIYGKNAILWREADMVGSFVTPKDETLKDFVRQAINPYASEETVLNRKVATAMTVFTVLSGHGLKYQVDPNTPYSKVSADQVDYVQFPRETLRLKSGDCDDLSVLLAAALENLGVETAFVDIPGHLFFMFNTGLAADAREQVSTQDDLLVLRDGQVWIPLEATMIATSFSEAWAEGARKFREAEKAGTLKIISLRRAWERYMPVTLAPAGYAIEPPAGERVKTRFEREHGMLLARALDRLVRPYQAIAAVNPKDPSPRVQVGILYAKNGLHELALKEFDQALALDSGNSAAHNNRGNVYYNQGDYERALEAYRYASRLDAADGGVRLNMALGYYRLGKLKEAAESFQEAAALDRSLETRYQSFKKLLGG